MKHVNCIYWMDSEEPCYGHLYFNKTFLYQAPLVGVMVYKDKLFCIFRRYSGFVLTGAIGDIPIRDWIVTNDGAQREMEQLLGASFVYSLWLKSCPVMVVSRFGSSFKDVWYRNKEAKRIQTEHERNDLETA